MYCPACADTTMVMSDRNGIEIDYCPKCRGVWLDRGELDKIIERSAGAAPEAASRSSGPPPAAARQTHRDPPPRSRERDDDDDDDRDGRRRKRRGGFLSDLFDFD